ncbi:unnamed protein product [Menidia menidia]|uniref:(Atlantic silverside) hypothetical protein n=1 Tax=Menidia menidia TaxID=238744 RepID=A0A8S4BYU0_9TELE|nr:unnamed protein product [Menidia menidia]
MSSYFVNPLFSKYKGSESLEPTYYDCRFPQSVARSHTLVYGPGAAAPGFQHPSHHVQDFFHHGTTGISNPGYQQNPCALACHGDATKFYGYEALPRQTLYGTQQDASLAQYPDCKSSSSSNPGEGQGHLNQNSSPSLMFPWMRPHGQKNIIIPFSLCVTLWRAGVCASARLCPWLISKVSSDAELQVQLPTTALLSQLSLSEDIFSNSEHTKEGVLIGHSSKYDHTTLAISMQSDRGPRRRATRTVKGKRQRRKKRKRKKRARSDFYGPFYGYMAEKERKKERSHKQTERQGGRERQLYDHPSILSSGNRNPTNIAVINRQNSPFPRLS